VFSSSKDKKFYYFNKGGIVGRQKRVSQVTICPFCGKFIKKMDLHLKLCKRNPDIKDDLTDLYECALCGKKFTQKKGLFFASLFCVCDLKYFFFILQL
jgi:hypothetical protein